MHDPRPARLIFLVKQQLDDKGGVMLAVSGRGRRIGGKFRTIWLRHQYLGLAHPILVSNPLGGQPRQTADQGSNLCRRQGG
jgi:hypothetical protein